MTIENITSIKAKSYPTPSTHARGTALVDTMNVSYDDLVSAFGDPTIETDNYKTDAEWHVSFTGYDRGHEFVTIYNYKDGKNYLGRDGLNVKDITNWHIGAKSRVAYWALQDFLKQQTKGN